MGRKRKGRTCVVVWWGYRMPFYVVTRRPEEAERTAALRNGVLIEIVGTDAVVKRVVDHWRHDGEGNPVSLVSRASEAGTISARRVVMPR